MSISVVIPFFNEEENIKILVDEIHESLKNTQHDYELILINDASTDDTLKKLKELKKINKYKINIINNETNIGQSLSLFKGIELSNYDTIVTLDGDGQNNPKDIPFLLSEYRSKNNIGLVSGVRTKRKDKFIKKVSSKIANTIRRNILKDDCYDTGCSLKVFSKKIFLKFPKFTGLHRFLPALFKGFGYTVIFLPVDHRPRIFGKSNYGTFFRLLNGCKDIIKVLLILKKIKK